MEPKVSLKWRVKSACMDNEGWNKLHDNAVVWIAAKVNVCEQLFPFVNVNMLPDGCLCSVNFAALEYYNVYTIILHYIDMCYCILKLCP